MSVPLEAQPACPPGTGSYLALCERPTSCAPAVTRASPPNLTRVVEPQPDTVPTEVGKKLIDQRHGSRPQGRPAHPTILRGPHSPCAPLPLLARSQQTPPGLG